MWYKNFSEVKKKMLYYPVEWSEKVLMGIWDSYAKENLFFCLNIQWNL